MRIHLWFQLTELIDEPDDERDLDSVDEHQLAELLQGV